MSEPSAPVKFQRITDIYGRSYRVGESDRDLLGYSRNWVVAGAWLGMLAVSATQYGFGVLAPQLATQHGWRLSVALAGFALWVCCYMSAIAGLTRWRNRNRVSPAAAVLVGGLGSAAGLFALVNTDNALLALGTYGVVGGVGTGLVYSTCLATVNSWHPERPARVGLVTGAFAYGSVPLMLAYGFSAGGALPVDVMVGCLVGAVVVGAAVLRRPPADWWPADTDPRQWWLHTGASSAARRHDHPAFRQYTVGEVARCPVTRPLYLLLACTSAVALFDIGFLVILGRQAGWGMPVAAGGLAAFAAGSGAARTAAVCSGNRFGRARTLRAALGTGIFAQLGLLGSIANHSVVVFVIAALVAGAATGACYGLLPSMVQGYFGDQPGLPNLWLLYTSKASGGVLGVGLAVLALGGGYIFALPITAGLCLVAAVLTRPLRRPGFARVSLPGQVRVSGGGQRPAVEHG